MIENAAVSIAYIPYPLSVLLISIIIGDDFLIQPGDGFTDNRRARFAGGLHQGFEFSYNVGCEGE